MPPTSQREQDLLEANNVYLEGKRVAELRLSIALQGLRAVADAPSIERRSLALDALDRATRAF